jgi:hypothetical protein
MNSPWSSNLKDRFLAVVRNRGPDAMKHDLPAPASSRSRLADASNRASVDTATLELLASREAQDATDNAEDLLAAERDLSDFKRAMNENRAIYP